ncbi:MAG: LPS export ABC transporter ATP-binding protein [Bacillota bacterium]|nr:LPS export ABC transporter ATP-binding protein [Bacillota bacterium]NLU55660.1 LPS export ABC transporter ATP-binding protein [Bacillota bacterium]HOA90275.1 LPS export ABC transporter ATP-binding protein [Bacillota bacterium]HOP53305.1 LPS export ABC transporter ATP-binding protein [Bacillota bacterium]HPT60012.1 LPS export ABC transporter ATP-binding protein [Bacillota bacterium]
MTIRAENLVKIYGQRKVVDEVTIEVNRGEVVGLLGPNGAGKTTTFYMIVGIESVNGGRILLDGHDVTHLSMHKRALKGIGYLPQEPSVFRKLTVEENIMAILEARGADAKTQRHRTEELIEEFKLGVVRKTKGIRLSGGERRRTEIARALATDPSFILLDEPFAGVDPIAVADIQEIIAMLREKNLGVLITDHNVRETLTITDRAYIMHEGHILVEGSSKEIANDPDARRLYLGERFSL